jgi:hypothetical protein
MCDVGWGVVVDVRHPQPTPTDGAGASCAGVRTTKDHTRFDRYPIARRACYVLVGRDLWLLGVGFSVACGNRDRGASLHRCIRRRFLADDPPVHRPIP